MAFGAIEIFALIFAIYVVVKGIFALANPKGWLNFVKGAWKNPWATGIISLILAAIVLYYLLGTLTIVQIFAVMLFVALLSGLSMAPYSKEMMAFGSRVFRKGMLRRSWLPLLVWLLLVIWVLAMLF